MTAPTPGILCASLTKTYGDKPVLCDLDLRVERGTVCALVGPNGAGKTTLFKILAGLVTPSGGEACIEGRSVQSRPVACRRRIGFASSEERSFYWRLTARENLRFFAALHGTNRRETDRRIRDVLTRVGLAGHEEVAFQAYSSGMKQSLGIARALLHAPPILLLDEPTRSLGPDQAARVRGILQQEARERKRTVLLSSHNLDEVEALADVVVVLAGGRIRAVGTPTELRTCAGLGPSARMVELFEHYAGRPRT